VTRIKLILAEGCTNWLFSVQTYVIFYFWVNLSYFCGWHELDRLLIGLTGIACLPTLSVIFHCYLFIVWAVGWLESGSHVNPSELWATSLVYLIAVIKMSWHTLSVLFLELGTLVRNTNGRFSKYNVFHESLLHFAVDRLFCSLWLNALMGRLGWNEIYCDNSWILSQKPTCFKFHWNLTGKLWMTNFSLT